MLISSQTTGAAHHHHNHHHHATNNLLTIRPTASPLALLLLLITLLLVICTPHISAQNYVMHRSATPMAADWVRTGFGSNLLVVEELSNIPPPAFNFVFFGLEFTTAKLHKHGSVHFGNGEILNTRQCSNGSCVDPINLSEPTHMVSNAIIPLNFKNIPADATWSHQYFSNTTHWIFRTQMISSSAGGTAAFSVVLMAPSVIVVVLEPSQLLTLLQKDSFSGLVGPFTAHLHSSPINDDQNIPGFADMTEAERDAARRNNLYPSPLNIRPGRMVSFRRTNYAYGTATVYCTMGTALCSSTYISATAPTYSVTTNGDLSCFRSATTTFLKSLFTPTEPYPPMVCRTMPQDATSISYTPALYDSGVDTFYCERPAAAVAGKWLVTYAVEHAHSAQQNTTLPNWQPPLQIAQTSHRRPYVHTAQVMHPGYHPPLLQTTIRIPVVTTPDAATNPFGTTTPLECHCASLRYRASSQANPRNTPIYLYGSKINTTTTSIEQRYNTTITAPFYEKPDHCYKDCAGTLRGSALISPCGHCLPVDQLPWGPDGQLDKTKELTCFGMCETMNMRNAGHYSYLSKLPAPARTNGLVYPNSPFHEPDSEDIAKTPMDQVAIPCPRTEYKDGSAPQPNHRAEPVPTVMSSATSHATSIMSVLSNIVPMQVLMEAITPMSVKSSSTTASADLTAAQREPDNWSTKRQHLSTTVGLMDGFKIFVTILAALAVVFAAWSVIKTKRREVRRQQRRMQHEKERAQRRRAAAGGTTTPAAAAPAADAAASANTTAPNNSSGDTTQSSPQDGTSQASPPASPTATTQSTTANNRSTTTSTAANDASASSRSNRNRTQRSTRPQARGARSQ